MPESRRIAFRTVGCRLNQAETAELAAACREAGWQVVADRAPCDVLVVHSCAVTAAAQRDSLRLLRQAARRARPPRVVLCGCLAELPAAVSAGADLLLRQADKFDLPARLAALFGDPPPAVPATPPLPLHTVSRPPVRVQDGCPFDCAYCIVPHTRQRLWSRPVADTVAEIAALCHAGHREVVLTGANLGLYRAGPHDLADLVAAIEAGTPLPRLRISSIEPGTVERRLAARMADDPRLCPFLHLPLQNGSDRVLAAMGRRYRAREYAELVRDIAAQVPGLGLGTDLVMGFPGETGADVRQTLELLEALPFSNVHVFAYSERPGTRAATLPDSVPVPERKRRVRAVLAAAARKRLAFAQGCVGRPVDMLCETLHPDGSASGWTGAYIQARASGAARHGANAIVRLVPTTVESGPQGPVLVGARAERLA